MVRSIGNYDEVGCSGYYSFLSALTRGTDENKVATISTDDTVALVTEDENFSGVVRVISQGDKLAGVQTDGWAEVEYTAGDELMPNQADRDFSGASAWENVDIDSYNETNDLSITANAKDQYCYLPVASAPTIIGRRYRLTFDVANLTSTWTIKSYDGTQTIGTVSAGGAQLFEFTAETTGGLRIVANTTTSSGDFDNFSLSEVPSVGWNYLVGGKTDGKVKVAQNAIVKVVSVTVPVGGDELMPNQADRDFSGASAWENVDIDSYNETNDLSITANAANQYCKIAETSVPTVAGRRYRLYFDVANLTSTWTIKSYDGTQTIGTVSQNGTNQYLEFVAATDGGLRIVAGSNTSSADFDNFSLKEVGVGSSDEDEELIGGTIIGVYSVTNQDQLVDNVELDENGAVNIRLAAGATAANYFKVEVLKSEDQWPKAYLVRSVDDTNYKCTLFLDN